METNTNKNVTNIKIKNKEVFFIIIIYFFPK